ncbi:tRNA (guanosine(37)-N1)-methyltransferase TrmD [Fuchsiella alkaliacetigena]|nr:tRNA (guanosine(37)-N1)-methyltransferase TrmD [Fuchsiella alkaliacetigena]
MKFDVLTIFPQMFSGPLDESILKRAQEEELIEIELSNIRDFATDKHSQVDDYSYGGGAGMVMKPGPIFRAVESVNSKEAEVILMSPQGRVLEQDLVCELAQQQHLVLICGRYEGVDERIREELIDREISIGDYVLTGGELPAMVLIDAVSRMIPGVLGKEESAVEDSFYQGILDYPHYTRPREYQGLGVPEVLLSGDHQRIAEWRRRAALKNTLLNRPELLAEAELSAEDEEILAELKQEFLKSVEDGVE